MLLSEIIGVLILLNILSAVSSSWVIIALLIFIIFFCLFLAELASSVGFMWVLSFKKVSLKKFYMHVSLGLMLLYPESKHAHSQSMISQSSLSL